MEVETSKKYTPLQREVHFQVKIYKTHHSRTTFPNQNIQNTPGPDHFWKLRCRKSACRCGAKYISKSKCTKYTMFGPLLEVQMSKKCMPLWREVHFEVKIYKTLGFRPIFGGSNIATLYYITLRSTTLHYITQHYNYNYTTTLHYTSLHCTTPTTLHYITLHYITLNDTAPQIDR